MINFKNLEIIGFGSIMELKYKFNDMGLHIIKGANGSGKTSILSAFMWVIYGQVMKEKKDVNTWEHKRPQNYKGTKVTLNFLKGDIPYTIVRCENYKGKIEGGIAKNQLFVYHGMDRLTFGSKPEMQIAIQKIIGMSPSLFKNTILFGLKQTRLLSLKGPEQKALFQEAFEVLYIDNAKKIAESDRTKIQDELGQLKISIDRNEASLKSANEVISLLKDEKRNFNKEKIAYINDLKEQIKKVKEIIKTDELDLARYNINIPKLSGSFQDVEDEIFKITHNIKNHGDQKSQLFKVELQISDLEGKIENYDGLLKDEIKAYNSKSTKCSQCGIELGPRQGAKRIGEAKKRINELKRKKLEVSNKLAPLKIQGKELKQNIDNTESLELNKQLRTRESERNSITQSLSKYQAQAKQIENNNKLNSIRVDELEHKIKVKSSETFRKDHKIESRETIAENITRDLETQYIDLKNLQIIRNRLEWLIKEPLGNKGLKNFIFSTMLDDISKRLDFYAQYLGYFVKFDMDLESANKNLTATIFNDKNETAYDSLSGGEQQLVDIAVAFALHDLMLSKSPVNILILDEVFESLDTDNIDIVSDLLKQKQKSVSVHLITHRKEFSGNSTNELNLRKDKGGLTQIY